MESVYVDAMVGDVCVVRVVGGVCVCVRVCGWVGGSVTTRVGRWMGRLRPPTPSLIKDTADYFNLYVAAADIKEQLTEMWLHPPHIADTHPRFGAPIQLKTQKHRKHKGNIESIEKA